MSVDVGRRCRSMPDRRCAELENGRGGPYDGVIPRARRPRGALSQEPIILAASFLATIVAVASAAAPATVPDLPPPTAPAAGDMAFDLFGDTPQRATPEAAGASELSDALQRRRGMLQLHQAVGLGTLGVMALTAVLGGLNYNDLYSAGGGRTGRWMVPHRVGVVGTTLGFGTVAVLGLTSPKPYELNREGIDTVTVHKSAVFLASLGMAAQIGLGFWTARHADAGNGRNLKTYATVHQWIGYGTLACLSAAALVWVF